MSAAEIIKDQIKSQNQKIDYFVKHRKTIEYQLQLNASTHEPIWTNRLHKKIPYEIAKSVYDGINKALNQLSPLEKEIFNARERGKTYQYIADCEGLSRSTTWTLRNNVYTYIVYKMLDNPTTARHFSQLETGIDSHK